MKQFIFSLLFCLPFLAKAQLFINVSQTQMPYGYTNIYSMDVKSGDFDNDGNIDVVIAADGQKNAIFFNVNGTLVRDTSRLLPQITTYQSLDAGEASYKVAVADFDGDNDLDLIFVSQQSNYHEYLINDGAGHFTKSSYQFPKSGNASSIVVADFTGNNLLDVVIGYKSGDNALFINGNNGLFYDRSDAFLIDTPGASNSTNDLAAVDIDNDGDIDLLEAVPGIGCQIHINVNGKLKIDTSLFDHSNIGTVSSKSIDVVDVDNDGDLDIYLSNGSDPQQGLSTNKLFLNNGSALFTNATHQLPASFEFTPDAGFMDINYDGYIDIIHTIQTQAFAQKAKVYLNDPANPGHFIVDNTVLPNVPNIKSICLHLADFNGDGKKDVYFGNTFINAGSNIAPGFDQLLYSQLGVFTTQLEEDLAVNIFPNPVSDILTIEHNQKQSLTTIELFNANGQLILQQSANQSNQEKININHLNTGFYIVKLRFSSGHIYHKKVLIR